MSCRGIGARATLGVFVLLVSMAFTTVGSWAAGGVKLCVPKAEGSALLTPKHGKCRRGYKLTSLGAEGKEGKAGKAGPEGKEGVMLTISYKRKK